ncbi:MAG: MerR family transcriptional regulator [Candidatus Marinimicrobia bacterium]|nr:MerR family transcriptional regulator [Candidatus Neomarinimicrobiota bacterium]
MSKRINNDLSTLNPEIITQNGQLYYSPVAVSRLLRIPIEISEVIINGIEDSYPEDMNGPSKYLSQKYVNDLQDPGYRWILDLITWILPFKPKFASTIASYLPTFGDRADFCFESNFHLEGIRKAQYDEFQSSVGLESIARKINPNIPRRVMPDGLLKTSQVAEILGVSQAQLRTLVKNGMLNCSRSKGDSGHYRFTTDHIGEYLSETGAN